MELAGEVEAIGKNVTLFNQGDKIFASTELRFGTYAEYTCLSEDSVIAPMPKNVTYEEAAPILNGAKGSFLHCC